MRTTKSPPFNINLLHLYPDGGAAMGWHRHKEAELVPADRDGWQHSGTLVQMQQGFQSQYHHFVFKDPKLMTPRINLSFRNLLEPSPHE